MNDEAKQPEEINADAQAGPSGPTAPENQVPPPAQEVPPPKTITTDNGEVVTLQPYHSVLVVMQDLRDGSLGIYNIQNCPHRSRAKSILNDALDHYHGVEMAASMMVLLAKQASAEPKKKGFVLPFGKKD